MKALDILMIDTYPVQHKPFPESDLSTMTRFTDSALRQKKPVMPINQCFNWKALAGEKETYRGSPAAELRYPTREELRYWCYSGAAQGVTGHERLAASRGDSKAHVGQARQPGNRQIRPFGFTGERLPRAHLGGEAHIVLERVEAAVLVILQHQHLQSVLIS